MMRLFVRILLVVFACLVITACEKEEEIIFDEPLKEILVNYSSTELELMNLVNEHRVEMGLSKLIRSGLVSKEAVTHTVYMIEKETVSHDNFSIRTSNLFENASAVSVSENLGYGYSSADGFMNAWLNSAEHRKNIEGDYSHCGISAKKDDEGRYYITHIFIERG